MIKSEGVQPTTHEPALADARLSDEDVQIESRITILGHIVRVDDHADRTMATFGHVGMRSSRWNNGDMVIGVHQETCQLARTAYDPRCALIPIDDVLDETQRLLTNGVHN